MPINVKKSQYFMHTICTHLCKSVTTNTQNVSLNLLNIL